MCFIHVLLNAADLKRKGHEVCIVIEGAATKLVQPLAEEGNPLHRQWEKVKSDRLVDGVCKACATKMGTLAAAEEQGLALLDGMSGHPAMETYAAKGFTLITF